MTRYHLKKRIDIIVETSLVRLITRQLDAANVSGYSVMPILQGRGMVNAWSSEGQVSNASNMVALLCIVDPSRAEAVIDAVISSVKQHIGFLTISDVFVIRPERFAS